jgi:DNA-binding CsgD family transcriptional regulator
MGQGTKSAAAVRRTSPAASLTRRELDVLTYLSDGRRTQAEIAVELEVSVETVRSHTASIRRKLGVRRNRELIGVMRGR